MKKKNILVLAILFAPFMAMAQFKVDFSLSPGINKVKVETPGPGYDQSGFSFRGGADAIYMFNSNLGIGSGLSFSYYKSIWELPEIDRSSNAISIPLNLLYHFSSSPIEALFGTTANFNLNKKLQPNVNNKEEYKPLYLTLQVGAFYYLNDKFKLGIIADAGISPYYENKVLNAAPQYGTPIYKYFLQSLSLKLNYTLFGK